MNLNLLDTETIKWLADAQNLFGNVKAVFYRDASVMIIKLGNLLIQSGATGITVPTAGGVGNSSVVFIQKYKSSPKMIYGLNQIVSGNNTYNPFTTAVSGSEATIGLNSNATGTTQISWTAIGEALE